MKITPILYGRTKLPESMIFQDGSKLSSRPIVMQIFLIEAEGRRILVDAGCVTMPGYDMEDFIGPVEALRSIGISPLDITDLVLTHGHHDHVECTSLYERAAVYIQESELAEAKRYIPGSMHTVVLHGDYTVCDGVKILKSGGHTEGSSVVEVMCDGELCAIIGDECYLRECLDRRIPTGVSSSIEKSREFIEKYGTGEYKIYLSHDL